MPPGLSLSAGGVLSGAPTHAGNFQLAVVVTDGAGATVGRTYHITVDNAAGEAPALRIAPRPVQIYRVIGAPPPSTQASFNTTSGTLPFAAAILGVPQLSLGAAGGTATTSVRSPSTPPACPPAPTSACWLRRLRTAPIATTPSR